jgi:hypothetical protein
LTDNAGSHGLPKGLQTAAFFIDESGSRASAGRCFVMAGIKTRHPDRLAREIESIRQRHDFRHEFKFGRLTQNSYRPTLELIDLLEASDVHLAGTVLDQNNPFKRKSTHEAHLAVATLLVQGNVNRNEVAVVLMDGISTPAGFSIGERLKRTVNNNLKGTIVVQAIALDSKSNDLLQAADLVAGSIAHFRRSGITGAATSSLKAGVARRLAAAFDAGEFADQHTRRVNILTLKSAAETRKDRLPVVTGQSSAS